MQVITLGKPRNALADVSFPCPVLRPHPCPLDSMEAMPLGYQTAQQTRQGQVGGQEEVKGGKSHSLSIKSKENNNKTHKGQMLGVADSGDKT